MSKENVPMPFLCCGSQASVYAPLHACIMLSRLERNHHAFQHILNLNSQEVESAVPHQLKHLWIQFKCVSQYQTNRNTEESIDLHPTFWRLSLPHHPGYHLSQSFLPRVSLCLSNDTQELCGQVEISHPSWWKLSSPENHILCSQTRLESQVLKWKGTKLPNIYGEHILQLK